MGEFCLSYEPVHLRKRERMKEKSRETKNTLLLGISYLMRRGSPLKNLAENGVMEMEMEIWKWKWKSKWK